MYEKLEASSLASSRMTVGSSPAPPCDDIPRYRTDFVTYCSATSYFHVPLQRSSLHLEARTRYTLAVEVGLEAAGQGQEVRVSTLPLRRGARDTASPAYCPSSPAYCPSSTLPSSHGRRTGRVRREEKVKIWSCCMSSISHDYGQVSRGSYLLRHKSNWVEMLIESQSMFF